MLDIVGLPAEDLPDNWTSASHYADADHPAVSAFIAMALDGKAPSSDLEKAVLLFNGVRDLIRYNPYQINFDDDTYRSSAVAKMEGAFCVPKAILLTACLRQVGISAGVGFADVKNHLNSPKLAAAMGTDLFAYHGYVALKLNGKVFKVTPTFNKDLCDRFGVKAIEFDGTSDALFHEFDAEERKHMEYVKDRGIFENPPMLEILSDLGEIYPAMKAAKDKELALEEDPDFAA